ncbi:MAG TPA: hypothetical protein VJU61_00005, partial [Polyangiaceae bacterium]|nr:hypothetical protein [Polyangiaceae bacterium]
MAKKPRSDPRTTSAAAIQRREALKQLSALAISVPTLASIACSEDPETTDAGVVQNGAEAGAGGKPSGTLDAGSGTTDGATTGSATTGGAATNEGGATADGASADGGATGSTDAATPGGGAGDAGVDATIDAGAGDASASTADFFPPMFQDAPTCTLTPTDAAGEGPFFIHETEAMTDPSLVRVDMREGRPGVELQLHLRLLDSSMGCMRPIPDVEVYVWHTDALGLYSGFNAQNPDMQYM